MRYLAWSAAAVLLLTTGAAEAAGSATSQLLGKQWQRGDKCNVDAFRLYPDYTKEAVAKRDAYVRKCRVQLGETPRDNLAKGK
jgi:hypothetical protein